MRRRIAAWMVALGLASAACASGVGPGVPECTEEPGDEIATATIVQLQSVPTADWGPCIEELRIGWEYVAQFVESGRSVFWLDSDRVGDRFVEVALKESCDPGNAVAVGNPKPEIELSVRIDEEPGDIDIAVVPVAPRHDGYARALVTQTINRIIEGRRVALQVHEAEGSASDRIEAALRTVGIVMILDDREITSETVELRRTGHSHRDGLTMDEALEEIADDLGAPAYRAQWFHVFTGGCVVYTFDAKGAGAESIASEVREALDFYDLGALREAARRAGLEF